MDMPVRDALALAHTLVLQSLEWALQEDRDEILGWLTVDAEGLKVHAEQQKRERRRLIEQLGEVG